MGESWKRCTRIFFGRVKELLSLERWVTEERCRLVAIVGMKGIGKTKLSVRLGRGGIGKTDLSLKLVRGIEAQFDSVIWRRLLNAPKVSEILTDLIKFLSDQQEVALPDTVSGQISQLLHYLRQSRSLLIFDNVETILQGGKEAGQYIRGYEEYDQLFEQVAEVPHQSCLLLTSREKPPEIVRLNRKTGPVRLLELDAFGSILCVAFSPQGDLQAAGTATGEIRFWSAASGLPLQNFRGHTNWVSSVAFSPDGRTLASGSADQTVRLWEVSSGKSFTTLQGHANAVKSVAFSPDGRILASGSADQAVRLWEVSSGKSLTILQGHCHWVWSVAFSPNGKTLASGSYDGAIKLCNLQTGECLHTLRSNRPYERMNITQVRGLTEVQKAILRSLGAIEEDGQSWQALV